MKKILNKLRSRMALNIIGAIVLLLAIFGTIVSLIGYFSFTGAFKDDYTVSTYHMADTATILVKGDHIDDYLSGKEMEEYEQSQKRLDIYCTRMSVSLVYVIKVDTSDYGSFVSVFNSVDNEVDHSNYTPWELGHYRETTNDEYKKKYKALYSGESDYETVFRTHTSDGSHPHITTMVPVKDSEGNVTALLCIQRPIREIREVTRSFLIHIAAYTFVLMVIIAVFFSLYFRKQVVMPIKTVSDEATRFAKENTKGEPLGSISKFEEVANLATSIDKMETDMVNYVSNITALTAEKQRIGTELGLAERIQSAMLPHEFPQRSDFALYALMDPAKEVGGDFYDFFMVDDDHLAMVMADVSGKGIPGAMFMTISKVILQNFAMMGMSVGQTLTRMNDAICDHNKAEMFVTVWLGILELSTGRLTAANAGHEYPALRRANGKFELYKDKHGFVIGGMEGMRYKEYELMLEPGDKLFLYTDGVPEATDKNNELFGTDRMIEALNSDPNASPETILKNVRKAIDDFVKDAEQFDDLTMLCMDYKEKKNG